MERTLDSIKDVQIHQPKRGYRFSVDALLLEDFISAKHLNSGIELGAGSGIISILLAKRLKNTRIVSVELQRSLAECAKENVTLNGLDDRIEIVNDDIKHLKKIYPANKFDFAFSNPPFRKTATGLLSIDKERAVARHEIKITLSGLIAAASYLIKNTGKFYLIYHPFRLIELIGLLRKSGLESKRMKFVHSKIGTEAKMVLIEAVKGSGAWLKVDPPLYIYKEGGGYTDELRKIYGE